MLAIENRLQAVSFQRLAASARASRGSPCPGPAVHTVWQASVRKTSVLFKKFVLARGPGEALGCHTHPAATTWWGGFTPLMDALAMGEGQSRR